MMSSLLPEGIARRLSVLKHRLVDARLGWSARHASQPSFGYARRRVPVVVSLTTHGDRINRVHVTVETLLRQTAAAERVVLWISDRITPANLPAPLRHQMRRGLEVRTVPDIGPYTKVIYALRDFPQHSIVTVDDDTRYPSDLVGRLYEARVENPGYVHCYRAHEMTFGEDGRLKPYWSWRLGVQDLDEPSFLIFPTGVGGVLYPPGSLHAEVFNQHVFREICPTADDVWLKAMSVLNGVKSKRMPGPYREFSTVSGTAGSGLMQTNVISGRNDPQIEAVFARYDILRRLRG